MANKLFELLEAERPVIPDSNADYYIGYNNGLVMGQAIALKHDFESVVRCKDCDKFCPEEIRKLYNTEKYCMRTGWVVTDNDFCSYGERRTDE